MNFPIVYDIDGNIRDPFYVSNETKNNIQRVLREIWNHRPDYDPPTWKEFFDYSRSHSIDPCPDIDVWTTMEHVIWRMLVPDPGCILDDERIEPNMEDIVEEFFHRLEPVADGEAALLRLPIETIDQPIDEVEEEIEEVTNRKEKVAEVQQILDEIMETKDQKLDQGKYLALCNLLRDVHQE
tara:strand:- start:950 stop:1495 length:546 start_codon:yes stop_codon:yes gene_type:complete